MDALIDQVLETILHSAIWRSTWYLSYEALIVVAIAAFVILAIRRSKRPKPPNQRRAKYRYRKKYPD